MQEGGWEGEEGGGNIITIFLEVINELEKILKLN